MSLTSGAKFFHHSVQKNEALEKIQDEIQEYRNEIAEAKKNIKLLEEKDPDHPQIAELRKILVSLYGSQLELRRKENRLAGNGF